MRGGAAQRALPHARAGVPAGTPSHRRSLQQRLGEHQPPVAERAERGALDQTRALAGERREGAGQARPAPSAGASAAASQPSPERRGSRHQRSGGGQQQQRRAGPAGRKQPDDRRERAPQPHRARQREAPRRRRRRLSAPAAAPVAASAAATLDGALRASAAPSRRAIAVAGSAQAARRDAVPFARRRAAAARHGRRGAGAQAAHERLLERRAVLERARCAGSGASARSIARVSARGRSRAPARQRLEPAADAPRRRGGVGAAHRVHARRGPRRGRAPASTGRPARRPRAPRSARAPCRRACRALAGARERVFAGQPRAAEVGQLGHAAALVGLVGERARSGA